MSELQRSAPPARVELGRWCARSGFRTHRHTSTFLSTLAASGFLLLAGCEAIPTDPDTSQDPPNSPGVVEDPGSVADFSVTETTTGSATLSFTEVDDGAGEPANYDVRFAESPIGYGWGGATPAASGTCATPLTGDEAGSERTCTVEGLAEGTEYDFQVIAFRGTLNEGAIFGELSNVATGTTGSDDGTGDTPGGGDGDGDGGGGGGTGSLAAECSDAEAAWIWCDDFEEDRLGSYFEYDDNGGNFSRTSSVGVAGSTAMRAYYAAGQVSAGSLKLAVGRTPGSYFDPADDGTEDYREIYWRVFVKNEDGWSGGGGGKLSRATVLASSDWSQAMIAHVWTGTDSDDDALVIDPASGTTPGGALVTSGYNDFTNLSWLGSVEGSTPLFSDGNVAEWYCVEAHVRLNDAGMSNGEFQLWIDGELDAERTDLNWLGSYDEYGINAVFLESYWNSPGSPQAQERYLDNFVVSTERIGC